MTIGTNIRKLRLAKNVTMRGLAKKVSTSPSTILKIERDGQEPGVYLANRIAKALKTTIDKII